MPKAAIAGISATILYFLALAAIISLGVEEFSSLSPNEWGDFIAGSLGPLAIFWLILGYFQQGRELRNSVEALSLQTKELEASVEQQRELVRASREAIDLEKNQRQETEVKRKNGLQPNLRFEIYVQPHLDNSQLHIEITNFGRPIINVEFRLKHDDEVVKYWPKDTMEFNDKKTYSLSMPKLFDQYIMDLRFRYLDGDPFIKLFEFTKRDNVAYDWHEL